MPVNFSVRTRSTSLLNDQDSDNVADGGDVIRTTLTFHNTGSDAALDVTIQDLLNGSTLVPGSIKIGPMAVDDVATISGNTPQVFTFEQLLGNDLDPDGSHLTMTITGVSGANHGTVTIDTIAKTVTFTPETGYQGAASFKYSVADADGLTNVAGFEGTVNVTVNGLVWYVDANYAGANGAPDGSYLRPFTSLTNLNDDGTVGAGRVGTADGIAGDDDVDGSGDTIFVYDAGPNLYNGGITLEAGQKLFGDAHTFVVNGISIGGASTNQTTINSHSVNNTNYGVTLSTGNEIRGINLDGDNTGTTNLRDGGGNVGNLVIDNSSISGSGQTVDIDQGGNLNVTLTSLSSAGSTVEGAHLSGVTGQALTGSFTANGGLIQNSTGSGFLVGQAGGGTASSGGSIDITYTGGLTNNGGAATNAIEIQDRTGGTVTFSGAVTETAGPGIVIDGNAGTITFSSTVSLSTATSNALTLSNNSGTVNFSGGGNGLDITTTTGVGLTMTNGGTLNVQGSGNTIASSTGQMVNINGGSVGSNGITFGTMNASGIVTGTAVSIVNLDGSGNTFNGGNVTVAGSTADGLFIGGNSAATFSFGTVTVGATQNVTGDGIEIDGAGNGSVTISTAVIDRTGESAVEIVGNTGTVTISNGTVGGINDAAAETVLINGGSGNVTINASLTNATPNVDLIDISNRTGGTVAFSGTLSSTGGAGGIDISGSAGTVNFTGSQITLTTGANAAVNITTNTAAINFTGGSLDITTTSGTGFSANATGGSVTVTGSSNTITTTTGTGVNIQGTDIGAAGFTLQSINTNGAANGILLNGTGTGAFTVTGTGAANSGGTITASTGAGISLTNTGALNLTQVNITNGLDDGISGSGVVGLSLTNVDVVNNGNAVLEDGVFFSELTGTATITNSTFDANEDDNLWIVNTTGTLNLTITGSTFNGNTAAPGDNNILLEANGSANINALITSSNFNTARGDHLQFSTNNTASGSSQISFTNNNLTNAGAGTSLGGGVTISPAGDSDLRLLVSGNTITDTVSGYAINLNALDISINSQIDATIQNNTIGAAGVDNSGPEQSGAIQVRMLGSGTVTALVQNNTIHDFGSGSAIDISAAPGVTYGADGVMNVTVQNNTVDFAGPLGSQLRSISFTAGASAGASNFTIRAEVQNNDVDTAANANDIRFIVHNSSEIQSPGYTGPADGSTFGSFIAAQNPLGGGARADLGTSPGTYANTPGGAAVPLPLAPNQPPPLIMLAPEPPLTPPADEGDDKHAGEIPPPTDDGGTGTGTGTGGKDGHAGDLPDVDSHPVIVDDGMLSQAELDYLVDAAIERWVAAGASAEQVAAMRAATFSVADMTGVQLGMSDGSTIYIDNDGGGAGWFLDTTPGADEEYAGSGTLLTATGGTAAEGVDLLTVLMHELGHQAGLGDTYNIAARDDLMYGYAYEGERRLPADGQAADSVPGSIPHPVFQLGPTVVGTVPGDNAFTVQYDSTVNAVGEDRLVQHFNVAADIGWREVILGPISFASTNSELLVVDSLTLGNRIFRDANGNGIFDLGDSGIAGVSLTLFADTNNNGVYDEGVDLHVGYNEVGGGAGYQPGIDTPAAAGTGTPLTATTDASGFYAFNYLAPGDYIVRVDASNFTSGGPLDSEEVIAGAADPNLNADGDNNGQAFAGFVATRAIRLDFGLEPTDDGDADADTNLTLDIGFEVNDPPVANDDSGLIIAEDTPTQFSTELTGNDTDPENDTLTITGVSNFVNGTASVTAGVVTFTPAANFVGTASFDYTVDDGNGNTDTATATLTVTAINDAPVNSVPAATQTFNEDGTLTFNAATSNLISVSDVDAGTADVRVTLSIQTGALTLNAGALAALTTVTGNGTSNVVLTGTVAEINAALDGLVYNPGANYNGDRTLTVTTDDLGNTGADPGGGGTGTLAEELDSDSISIHVTAINDAPVVIGDGTVDADPIVEDTPGAGQTASDLFSPQYSDAADAQFGAGNPGGSSPGTNAGVAVVANGSSGATGQWQYLDGTSTWVDIGARSTASALLIGAGTFIRFNPALDFTGTAPTLTVHLIDNSLGFGILYGQVVDISGVGATGGSTPYSTGTVVLSQEVIPANASPVLDLDADDSNSVGTGYAASYTEGGAAAAISDTDVSITDAEGDDIVSATIAITNAVAGDVLTVVGALPAGLSIDPGSTATNVIITGAGTAADYQAAIEQISFSSTSDDPTDGGSNMSRSITVVVNDGTSNSSAATATIAVTDVNDAPTGTSSTISATEDTPVVLTVADLGFSDVDGAFASVTISAVTGGTIFYDSDGGGAGLPAAVTLPQTFTAADLSGGFVTFVPAANLNGVGPGSITFAVTDDDGASDGTPNTLTIDITAVNDAPVLSPPTSATITFTEGDVSVALLQGVTLSDVDLPANFVGGSIGLNVTGGAGSGGINLRAGSAFQIVPDGGGGFNLVYQPGATPFTIGTITGYGTPTMTIAALTSEATLARLNDLVDDFVYVITGDNPAPGSRTVTLTFDDGGNSGGGSLTDDVSQTLNVVSVNDAPIITLADATVSGTEDQQLVFSVSNGNAITLSDPDHTSLHVTIYVNSGTLTLATTSGLSVSGNGTGSVNISGTIADINAALDGLVYLGNLNFNGNDALSIVASDGLAIDFDQIAISLVTDGKIDGTSGDDNFTGTLQGDLFMLQAGGNDTATGLGGADGFYFGGAYTHDDIVHGDGGRDQLGLQGDYSGGVTLGTITGIEDLILLSGSITRFGDTANNFYSYDITTQDSNVAAGQTLLVDGVTLRAGENLTFDGSAETDGAFLIYAGLGVDDLTGGMGNDGFLFRGDGHLTGADIVNGGAGSDHLGLRGDYTGGNAVVFTAASMTGIEVIVFLSGEDVRFGPAIGPCSYEVTMHDANVLAGQRMIIDAATLRPTESLHFDGSAETDGSFRIVGGGCDDILVGSLNDDLITGALGGDILAGAGGNDRFIYRNVLESDPNSLPDLIVDFSDGDLIDLAGIDADIGTAGNQAFVFIDDNLFTGQAGQLRSEDLGSGYWLVQADVDGDEVSDFDLVVFSSDSDPIASNDFIM